MPEMPRFAAEWFGSYILRRENEKTNMGEMEALLRKVESDDCSCG
jgi:hypothetical protein